MLGSVDCRFWVLSFDPFAHHSDLPFKPFVPEGRLDGSNGLQRVFLSGSCHESSRGYDYPKVLKYWDTQNQ